MCGPQRKNSKNIWDKTRRSINGNGRPKPNWFRTVFVFFFGRPKPNCFRTVFVFFFFVNLTLNLWIYFLLILFPTVDRLFRRYVCRLRRYITVCLSGEGGGFAGIDFGYTMNPKWDMSQKVPGLKNRKKPFFLKLDFIHLHPLFLQQYTIFPPYFLTFLYLS